MRFHTIPITAAFLLCVVLSPQIARAQVHPDDVDGRPIPVAQREVIEISGVVRDAKGQPIPGAQVVIQMTRHARSTRPSGVQITNWLPIAEQLEGPFITDGEGRFNAKATRRKRGPHISIAVTACAAGHALTSKLIDLFATKRHVEIQLGPEHVVRGRVIDLKGQPAVGATVRMVYYGMKPRTGKLPPWNPVTTDDKGRFILRGLPKQYVYFETTHQDLASHQQQVLTTPASGMEKITITVAPAHTLFGRVTYEDSGKPVVGAAVIAPAADLGDPRWRLTRTDGQGRYRVNPFPPNRKLGLGYPPAYFLNVFPPNEETYLVARESIPLTRAARQEVNIILKRGIIVRGVVKDDSGKPVADARIQFKPAVPKGKAPSRIYMTAQPEASQLQTAISRKDGSYELAVTPGKGELLVLGPTLDFIPVTWRRGVYRRYAGGYAKLDLDAKKKRHQENFTLRRGVTLKGSVIGPDGRPASKFELISRGYMPSGYQPNTNMPAADGGFELHGCDPQKKYTVSLFDEKSNCGAAVVLTAANAGKPAEVRLQPCGKATVRFVTSTGGPQKTRATLSIVLTKGAPRRLYIRKRDKHKWPTEGNFRRIGAWETNEKGAVHLENLIPGADYMLHWPPDLAGFSLPDPWPHVCFTVKPGETKDLGKFVAEKSPFSP